MEMTKQRKMLIGVLCLGLGGLAVDRFVLGAPESASADDEALVIESPTPTPPAIQPATPAVPGVVPGVATDDVDNDAATLPSYESLTERLIKAQDLLGDGALAPEDADPFRVPEQWQAAKSVPQAEPEPDTTPSGQRLKAVLKLDGTVRSVIQGKEELMAVISGGNYTGHAIRIGQKVRIPIGNDMYEEYQLIEVGARYVVWRSTQTQQKIEMRVEKVL